jgi:hypothetical protein
LLIATCLLRSSGKPSYTLVQSPSIDPLQ